MPRVSVVIPNYNHARYLPERIASVLGQTFSDFEVLLLDDASTDGSVDVFTPLVAGDPRVRVVVNEANSGSGYRQWNKGVSLAAGEYVWIAESDDAADPRLLESLVARLDANPGVGVAYCQSWRVDEAGARLYPMTEWTSDFGTDRWERDYVSPGGDEVRRYLCRKNTIPNASAVLFRRRVFEEVGGVAGGAFRLCADWHLWARMLLRSDVAYVAEPLNFFRLESSSVTQRTKQDGTDAEESYALARFFLREVGGLAPETEEAVLALMFYVWTEPQVRGLSAVPGERNRRVYRAARAIDPRLHARLARAIVRYGAERARRLVSPQRGVGGGATSAAAAAAATAAATAEGGQ